MIFAMSSSVTRVEGPLDLHDASRERLLAEIGMLQHQHSLTDAGRLQTQIVQLETEIDQLKTEINQRIAKEKGELADAEMKLLHARDYARGCAAELGEARTFFEIHIADANRKIRQAQKKNQQIYATRTWKMGRLVMLPFRIVRRIIKVG